MNNFYVDPIGLDGLHNVLQRASGDADDTLKYAQTHCDLQFVQEGFLLFLASPHRKAYQRITESLQRLQTLTKGAATQVNLAQRGYATADVSASARLDQTYPGAKDPANVRGMVADRRPDLWPTTRSPFADVVEPTKRLVPPNYATDIEIFKINPLSDLISPAAWLRQVSVWLFNHDPFEGWGKAFSGDWQAYVHCAAAWRIIGNVSFDIGRNLTATAADVSDVWRGNAAEAEQEYQLALGAAAMGLHGVCDQYADLYLKAAEAAKNLFSVVSGLITKLIDVLIIVNLAAVVGTATIKTGVGAIAGYSVAAYYAWQAYDLYRDISKFYGDTEATLKAIAGSIAAIEAGAEVARLPELKPYRHPAGY